MYSGKTLNGTISLLDYRTWKGILDRLSAAVMLVLLSPLLVLIAVAIRIDSPGRAIFRQERVGKDGRRFRIYKFRTMYVNNDDSRYKEYVKSYVTGDVPYTVDQDGKAVYKIIDDARVTRFGAWLRQTNLDELPQILNVLRGEMSFVGPRPDVPFAVDVYSDWHRKRLLAKPGITGLWQTQRRAGVSFNEMVRLDGDYVERQALCMDAKILLKTVGTIVRRDGSYRSERRSKDGQR